MKGLIQRLTVNKRLIFLVDGTGALISALMLCLVLPRFQIGFPLEQLMLLGSMALVYTISSFLSALLISKFKPFWMIMTVVFNIVYCLITILFLYLFRTEITTLGFTYFIIEILIISCLVYIEILSVISVPKTSI